MNRQMKISLILCCFILIVAILLTPNPFDGKTAGAFYYQLDFAWCITPYACVHEAGHMLDEERGWTSESSEYQMAIVNLRNSSIEWQSWLDGAPDKNKYQEIYAEMYYIYLTSPNTIPRELEKFYQ